MTAKIVMVLILLLRLAYQGWTTCLEIKQRKKPLPPEISDIYDEERYKQFIAHETDINRMYFLNEAITIVVQAIILFSPLFEKIDRSFPGKPYAVFLITFSIFEAIDLIDSVIYDYIYTFKIDEKYGLNRSTKKEFVKDYIIDELTELISSIALYLVLVYAGEHMATWTNNFSVSWKTALLITAALLGMIILVAVLGSIISLVAMKKKYTFTPLENGELRNKIEMLLIGAKKIKQIYVYDESKKSVDKNAFLLKLLWHREFGIADNFLNENSERELLAVLSHEIGHLKHKKDIWNYIQYSFIVVLMAAVALSIKNPAFFLSINSWVRSSFNTTGNNYYLLLFLYVMFLAPITFTMSLYSHFVSRRDEREADMEAVKNGYGEDLINTFKRLSSDELVDIYPHPIIEFIENSHPGMYNRISFIRKATDSMKKCHIL